MRGNEVMMRDDENRPKRHNKLVLMTSQRMPLRWARGVTVISPLKRNDRDFGCLDCYVLDKLHESSW